MDSPNNRDSAASKPTLLVASETTPSRAHEASNAGDTAALLQMPYRRQSPVSPVPAKRPPRTRRWHKPLVGVAVAAALALGSYLLAPEIKLMLNTVSTDDAYVNERTFTFVAPRVAGQVIRVLVDDNYRVGKGDLLVQLDKEPFQIQVQLKRAAVALAKADLVAARKTTRAAPGSTGQKW